MTPLSFRVSFWLSFLAAALALEGCTLSATDAARLAITAGARTVTSSSAALHQLDARVLGGLTDEAKAHPERATEVAERRDRYLAAATQASAGVLALDLAVAAADVALSLVVGGAAARVVLTAAIQRVADTVAALLGAVATLQQVAGGAQ